MLSTLKKDFRCGQNEITFEQSARINNVVHKRAEWFVQGKNGKCRTTFDTCQYYANPAISTGCIGRNRHVFKHGNTKSKVWSGVCATNSIELDRCIVDEMGEGWVGLVPSPTAVTKPVNERCVCLFLCLLLTNPT